MNKKNAFSFSIEVQSRIDSGDIIEQKCWKYIKEVNGTSNEKLDLVAVTDGRRKYTYRQMFDQWKRYAGVFSAIGITGSNGSRVGVDGAACIKSTFTFFGLNMTGASVSLIQPVKDIRLKTLKEVIEKEHLTDIILPDSDLDADFLRQILREKDSMGLRNVIIFHAQAGGEFDFALKAKLLNMNYRELKAVDEAVFMEDLLKKYSNHEISYAQNACDEAAVIVHTSGTTDIPKSVPFSDRAINETLRRHTLCGKTAPEKRRMTTMVYWNLHKGAGLLNMLTPLANGGKMIVYPMSVPALRYLLVAEKYHVTNLVYFAALIDLLTMLPVRPDLSSVEVLMLVGSYVSKDNIKKCRRFFRECGSNANIYVGYGLTEAGVGLTLTDPDMKDDSVGYLLPGIKAKFWNEDEECFYEMDGKEHMGVLYVSTPSVSSGRLDDEVIFELEEIDGEKYLNTNDMFKVREDGALYYIGRANRFFINEKGVRFDAGLVERAISAQKGIKACGIAPSYNKLAHETEPVLYVETSKSGKGGYRIICNALDKVFITGDMAEKMALPVRVVITEHIPRNMNGKVDTQKIIKGKISGSGYKIDGVYQNEKLKEIKLTPDGTNSFMRGCSL